MNGRGQTLDYLLDVPMIYFLSTSIFREFTLSQLNMDSPMFHVSLFFLITSDRTRCGHMTFAGPVRYFPLGNLELRSETKFLNYRVSSLNT